MALAAENRLRKSSDFRRVLRNAGRPIRKNGAGARASDDLLQMAAVRAAGADPQVGLSVGKRVGGAVTRNRVRRRLREICRELIVEAGDAAPGNGAKMDFVITARPAAAEASYEQLRTSASKLISRIEARRGTAGTS